MDSQPADVSTSSAVAAEVPAATLPADELAKLPGLVAELAAIEAVTPVPHVDTAALDSAPPAPAAPPVEPAAPTLLDQLNGALDVAQSFKDAYMAARDHIDRSAQNGHAPSQAWCAAHPKP